MVQEFTGNITKVKVHGNFKLKAVVVLKAIEDRQSLIIVFPYATWISKKKNCTVLQWEQLAQKSEAPINIVIFGDTV